MSGFPQELFQGKQTVEKRMALNKYRRMIELKCYYFETPNKIRDLFWAIIFSSFKNH